MITLLYGPDGYRRDERKNGLIGELRAEGAEVLIFDGAEEGTLGVFLEFIASPALFSNKRFAAVTGIAGSKEAEKAWIPAMKMALSDPDVHILLVMESAPTGVFSFLLKPPSQSESFPVLRGNEWLRFAARCAAEKNVVFDDAALRAVAEAYEGDTRGFVTEIEKLSWIKKRPLGVSDLDFPRRLAGDFWTILNRLQSGSRAMRLRTLEELLREEDPQKLFYTLAAVLKGREDAVSKADLAVKSGKVEYEEALLGILL